MDTTRREFVAGGVASLAPVADGLPESIGDSHGRVNQFNGDLLNEDFESVPVGGYPEGWTAVGNQQQEVIETEDAAEGSRCLVLQGQGGDCWEALADAPTSVPEDTPVTFRAWIGPVREGSNGCHDHHASLSLRTATGTWDAGNGVTLVKFRTDGEIQASDGTSLGTYEWGVWTRFEMRYEREDGRVVQTYRIDGERRGRVERSVKSFEDEFEYLRLGSGEYVVYYDDLVVERSEQAGGDGERTATASESPASGGAGDAGDTQTQPAGGGAGGGEGSDSSGSSIIDTVVGIVQTVIGLGIMGFVLLVAYYFMIGVMQGSSSKSEESAEKSVEGSENDGVRYNEHGELINED